MNYKKLGDYVTEFSQKYDPQLNYPVYSVTNNNGFCTEYFNKDVSGEDKSKYKVVPRGYFAYNPSRINVGSVDWQKEEENVIVSPLYVIFKCSDKLNKDYLKYFLRSNDGKAIIASKVSGSVRNNLNFKALSSIEFNIGTIDEQNLIVSRLKEIENAITNEKNQIALYDELIKARFVEMFGDPVENPNNHRVVSLQMLIESGDILYHLDGNHGGDYPKSDEFVSAGVPYIGANCIVNGEIDYALAKYLTEERAGKLKKGIAQNEDVLFAHNATVGPTVVLHTDNPKVILSTSLTAYRCNKESIIPEYLASYMKCDGFVRQYSSEMKQTTRNQVPITAQRKYLFLVPPISEQEKFAEFVRQTNKSKFEAQKRIKLYEELLNKKMSEYFMN